MQDFHRAYRELEERMKTRADAEGTVFLPNAEPPGTVQYVLICMEPSLGRWAKSPDDARSRVERGFRNFLSSDLECNIVHFCARRYLCGSAQSYHVTDLSKGAMLVKQAQRERFERYDRWWDLLQDEINLCGPNAKIVAVGSTVAKYLERQRFRRPFTHVIHYSGQAASARRAAIIGHEDSFAAFRDSVSLQDVLGVVEETQRAVNLPIEFLNENLSRLATSQLTVSRQQLIFHYKVTFESMRSYGAEPKPGAQFGRARVATCA